VRYLSFPLLALFSLNAFAQAPAPIERIKITDNDLSCKAAYDELQGMDKVIAETKAAQSSGQTTATAGQAAGVAAEVASRTGLFGSIGGLTGHIFGTVASKTAANVAEQQGQMSAAQAAEREKQALARKEHLTQIFLAKGCSASDPSAPGKTPTAALPMPVAPAVVAPKTPEQALKETAGSAVPIAGSLDYKADISANMKAMSRVVVPQFRVAFVAKTGVSARGGAGLANLGQSTGYNRTITQAQSARVDMMLGNVDYALMQGLADQLHADFVKRLTAAGKTVVSIDEMKKTAGYAKVEFVKLDKPYVKSPFDDPREYIFATPKDLPLAFMHMDTQLGNAGAFDQNTTKAFAELGVNTNALVLVPTVIIDFAQLESSGNSRFATSAEASATPKVGLGATTLLVGMIGQDFKIGFGASDARFSRLNQPFFAEGEFGTVKPVDSFDNVALANSLTSLTGTQGTQYRYEKKLVTADPAQYAKKVMQVGATINQAFVDGLKP
jgi:hypothetical protein